MSSLGTPSVRGQVNKTHDDLKSAIMMIFFNNEIFSDSLVT